MALVRQPKTAVLQAKIEVQIYRTPALKVLKSFCANFFKSLSFTMRMVFAGFGQNPKSCLLACR